MRLSLRFVPLWLTMALLTGCGLFEGTSENQNDVSTPEELDPAFLQQMERLPSSALPWKANPAAIVPRGTTFVASSSPTLVMGEKSGGLIAVAAAKDSVFVVFPPQDRTGLDLAWAGVDQPWQRVPLVDTPIEQIGAVDAIGDWQGNVHIVVRETTSQFPLTYLVRTADGSIQSNPLPRPTPMSWDSAQTHCDDVQLGVTPSGDIDVVFQHTGTEVTSTQVVVAHKAAGAKEWTYEVALDDSIAQGPAVPFFGCRNRLAYDEEWKPVLVVQTTAFQNGNAGHSSLVLLTGADGHFYQAHTNVQFTDDASTWRAEFDITRSLAGHAVVGNNSDGYDYFLNPILLHGIVGLALDQLTDTYRTEGWGAPGSPAKHGGKLGFTPCGTAELWSPAAWGQWPLADFAYSKAPCPAYRGLAPVRMERLPEPTSPVYVFTHGFEPFRAALCMNDQGDLNVCMGGHFSYELNRQPEQQVGESSIAPFEAGAKVVSTSLKDGATDVPANLAAITFTLENWPYTSPGEMTAGLYDGLGRRTDLPIQADAAAKTLTVNLPAGTLLPGHRFFLHLPAAHYPAGGEWPSVYTLLLPPPELEFTVAGSLLDPEYNPREQPIRLANCAGRDETGCCLVDHPSAVPLELRFGMTRNFRLAGDATVLGPDGLAWADATVQEAPGDGTNVLLVTSTAPVLPDSVYQVVLPEVVDTDFGTRLPQEDQRICIRTARPPAALVSSLPADGATGVALDTKVTLEFNVPMEYATLAQHLKWMEEGNQLPLPTAVLKQSPTVFQVGTPSLKPSTLYRIELPTNIQDDMGQPLAEATTITFTTGL